MNQYAINDSIGAYEAGFDNFDVYLSPCPKCNKTASKQVQEMGRFKILYSIIVASHCAVVSLVTALKTMSYGHIWLDIEVVSTIQLIITRSKQ